MSIFSCEIITMVPPFWQNIWSVYRGPVGRAINTGKVQLKTTDLHAFGEGPHRKIDDKPYGGGAGMLLMAPVAYAAIQSARAHTPGPVLLMTPRGKRFTQKDARRLSQTSGFSLLCPRFEGIDERIYSMVDEQISVGDFILSTGDMAAFVLLDAVIRLLPDVLGNAASLVEESFLNQLSDQEYPQYTRPQVFRGQHVPPVLTSGHHQHIQHWRTLQAQRLSSQETCSEGLECASGDVLKEQR